MANLPAIPPKPSSLARKSVKTGISVLLYELLNSVVEGAADLEGEPMEMLEDWSSERLRELWDWLMSDAESGGTIEGQRYWARYLMARVVCARDLDYAGYQALAAEFSTALEPLPGYTLGIVAESTPQEYVAMRQMGGCPVSTPTQVPRASAGMNPMFGLALIVGGMIASAAILSRIADGK